MSSSIVVSVGLLYHPEENRVLVCRRPPHKSYPLQWEFPGGKVEAGETPEEALSRELREELMIRARVDRLLHEQTTRYSDGNSYAVRYYLVTSWDGIICNNEFAELRWTPPHLVRDLEILEGNREICRMLASGEITLT